jgi:hypothetical protein
MNLVKEPMIMNNIDKLNHVKDCIEKSFIKTFTFDKYSEQEVFDLMKCAFEKLFIFVERKEVTIREAIRYIYELAIEIEMAYEIKEEKKDYRL